MKKNSYSHVGLSAPIHDGQAKTAGALKYFGDMQFPGMYYAKMVFSTVPHGIVKNINTDSAYNIDGVEKILTCFNTTKKHFAVQRFMRQKILLCRNSCFLML